MTILFIIVSMIVPMGLKTWLVCFIIIAFADANVIRTKWLRKHRPNDLRAKVK